MGKRLYLLIGLMVTVFCALWSCVEAEQEIPVTDVYVSKSSAELVEGETLQLEAFVAPENATDKSVSWSSSVPSVASVDAKGLVTAIKQGSAIIIAQAGTHNATCKLTVSPLKIEVESVTLDQGTLSMLIGDEVTLVATVSPENSTVRTVEWSTSDSAVATVSEGKVTAIKEGTATITATADGKTAGCKVTVDYIHVQSVVLNQTELSLYVDDTYTLTATVSPDDAARKDVTWSSSDTSVATVSGGKVTALKAGNAVISAAADGVTAACALTVTNKPEAPKTGIYVTGRDPYQFNPAEEQISIYSAEGSSWYRFLFPANLKMYQVGPISDNAAVGDTVTVVLETYTSGVESAQSASYTLSLESKAGGMMILTSAAGDKFILRY
ncbi:MAG: Ig domain-containing protein [Bacteroidales bacterium]|nr:Ig domain-containing protein [Bacteroidales bacterium]